MPLLVMQTYYNYTDLIRGGGLKLVVGNPSAPSFVYNRVYRFGGMWNGIVERWNGGMVGWSIDDPVPSTAVFMALTSVRN